MEEVGVVVLSLSNQGGGSAHQVLWHVGRWKITSFLLSPCYMEQPLVTQVLWVLLPAMGLSWSRAPSCSSPSVLFGHSSSRAQVSCGSFAHPAPVGVSGGSGHLCFGTMPWFSSEAPASVGSAAWLPSLSAHCGRSGTVPTALSALPVPSLLIFLGGVVTEAPWLLSLQKVGRGEGVG